MTVQEARIRCAGCDLLLEESPSLLPEEREPCPRCDSTFRRHERAITDSLPIHSQLRLKARHAGDRRPFHEQVNGADLHRDTGEWRRVHRVIDREQDRYEESIQGADGRLIREVDEPLSQHRGRGAAKREQS